MGHGKETPRQKMIGMMYLVLTALLALNVSSTVLDKFLSIDISLTRSADESGLRNGGLIKGIEKAVKDAGGRAQDVAVIDRAKLVQKNTAELNTILEELKEEMAQVAGGWEDKEDGTRKLIGASDYDKVGHFMINAKGGDKLMSALNGYIEFLRETMKDKSYPYLAYDGKDHPEYKDDKDRKHQSFAELTFEHAPTAAAMAEIAQYQLKVREFESKALNELAQKVGAGQIKFDNVEVMVRPESKIVASGAKYKAEMFIAASSSAITPQMYMGGRKLPVKNGKGIVTFKVSHKGKYDKEGLAKKSYKASIKLKKAGRDTTYVNKVIYYVAKPVINVQSASVNALYLNCGNELNVQVPALGSAYKPSFKAVGAKKIRGKKKGLVTLIPNSSRVTLKVYSDGTYIGDQKFKVRLIPKPTLALSSRGVPVDLKKGMKAPGPRSLNIKAVPDPSFKEFLPKDARYRISSWEITLARGSRPVKVIKSKSEKVNLTQVVGLSKPGDRIVVEVKTIKRMNFRNDIEDVNMGTQIFTIPLTN